MNPPNYVDVQKKVNKEHLSGRMEEQYEEAVHHVGTFATWLKAFGLPTDSFLDSGCRTGYAMEALAKHFPAAEVTGLDIVPEFVTIANRRGEAVVGDMQEMPFPDESFDWTFSCTSIEHCPDIHKAVAEMQRVSRYGFFVHTDLEDEAAFNKNESHFFHAATPDEWFDVFRHPDWGLFYMKIPRFNRIEMVWVRKKYRTYIKDTSCL